MCLSCSPARQRWGWVMLYLLLCNSGSNSASSLSWTRDFTTAKCEWRGQKTPREYALCCCPYHLSSEAKWWRERTITSVLLFRFLPSILAPPPLSLDLSRGFSVSSCMLVSQGLSSSQSATLQGVLSSTAPSLRRLFFSMCSVRSLDLLCLVSGIALLLLFS